MQSFKTGVHTIAVKVVDNDGLESMEIVQLKINGIVERRPPMPPLSGQ
jgi:hypothetical protein